jgi:hypothetical protein
MKIQNSVTEQLIDVDLPSVGTPTPETGDPAPDILPSVNALRVSGDPGAMLAALTMQSAHEQEETARAQRDDAMKAQASDDKAQIQDLHQKADLQRVQGIVDGACDVADAAMDMAQGAKTAEATKDQIDADSYTKGSQQNTADRLAAAKADQAASGWKSGTEAMNGLKAMMHGEFDAEITDKDADAKQQDISAQAFKQMADDAHDNVKDAQELLNKALDFYKEYTDTKNQTLLAASHRA